MQLLSSSVFRKIVFASAIYDVIVKAPFATPWSFQFLHQQLTKLNVQLGGLPLPVFSSFHTLIACLLGSVVMVWSALRISDPQQRFGRFDGVARMLFSTWMIWALIVTGAPILWLFVVPEFIWGVLQWMPVRGKRGIDDASLTQPEKSDRPSQLVTTLIPFSSSTRRCLYEYFIYKIIWQYKSKDLRRNSVWKFKILIRDQQC